jgi:hypothetical protein
MNKKIAVISSTRSHDCKNTCFKTDHELFAGTNVVTNIIAVVITINVPGVERLSHSCHSEGEACSHL